MVLLSHHYIIIIEGSSILSLSISVLIRPQGYECYEDTFTCMWPWHAWHVCNTLQ